MKSFSIVNTFSEVCSNYGNRVAVIQYSSKNNQKTFTFHQLQKQSDMLAIELKRRDVHPGQPIGVFMRRSAQHIVGLMGISKAGCAFFSIHEKFSPPQISYLLNMTNAPVLLVDNASLIRLASLGKSDTPELQMIIHLQDGPLNAIHESAIEKLSQSFRFDTVIPGAAAVDHKAAVPANITGGDLAMILFSSGSTGSPKGIMISHEDLVHRARHEISAYAITSTDRLLNLLTFSFDVGCNQLFSSLLSGATFVITNSWLPKDILNVVSSLQISGISGVPSIWSELLAQSADLISESMADVRYITVSGGDMAPIQLDRLSELLPRTGIYKTYGQTETFRSTMLFPDDFALKISSVGRPIPGTKIGILNPSGQPAAPGEVGEIIHGGMGTMLGYLGDEEGTNLKVRSDPFRNPRQNHVPKAVFTGDQGMIDDDGYLHILGRKDKMMKIKGNRVYPQEIFNQIISHDTIVEAVVFGVKDHLGEVQIIAEAILKTGEELTEGQLKMYLMKRLSSFMIPTKIIMVDGFPRTASGKIDQISVEAKYYEQN